MSTSRILAESLAPIVDFVFPPRCPVCGGGIAGQDGLCVDCWSGLVIPSDPRCAGCGRPFASAPSGETRLCVPCIARPPIHDGLVAATLYTEPARKLVLALKHGRKIALAGMLGRMIAGRMPDSDPGRIVVPVPLHRTRLWHRGYNQAALLGEGLSRCGHGRLLVDALVRSRPTPSLGGLGRKARARALSGAIQVNPRRKSDLRGADIVLVDDVPTSGATSSACVRALKRGGARRVIVACFARVLDATVEVAA